MNPGVKIKVKVKVKVKVFNAEKLFRYRENLLGIDQRLFIYCEGSSITRRIGSNSKDEIVGCVRRVHDACDEKFEQVWWGTNMLMEFVGGDGVEDIFRCC